MPTQDELEFVDHFGLFFETAGGSRTAGRMFGWLLISDPPERSITELATVLQASKASISTVVRQMQQAGFVERVPAPGSRQHHYRLKEGGWLQIAQARLGFLTTGKDLTRRGMKLVSGDPARQERLQEFADFLGFMEKEYGDEMIRRWEAYRRGERS
ncbi:MarR family transcriptional regulator [Nonomuraea sp. NPDC049129]|uniref:GbsR/MarR family transcriptional regulator n=1 Tax=unclassified Nonomuraea TaxID=2593643 RepID=UPI0033DF9E3A